MNKTSKMILLSLAFLIALSVLSKQAKATNIYDYLTLVTPDTVNSNTGPEGINVSVEVAGSYLESCDKDYRSTATICELWFAGNKSGIANATFVGDVATFDPVIELGNGLAYFVVGDKPGSAFDTPYKVAGGFPITSSNLKAVGSVYNNNPGNPDTWNMDGVTRVITKITTYTVGASTPTKTQLFLNNSENNISITYGQSLNATGIINVTGLPITIQKNGTIICSSTTSCTNITVWGTGYFQFTANYTGNDTYVGSSAILYVNVTPKPATLYLAFNGTQSDQSFDYPTVTNATGWSNNTIVPTLLRNGSNVGNTEVASLGSGLYNYTAYISNSNYTATPVTRWLTIRPIALMLNLSFNGTQSNTAFTYPSVINITAFNNISQSGQSLLRNGTEVSNPLVYQPSAGVYNFTTTFNDTTNLTFVPVSHTLTINQGASELLLTSSAGWSLVENDITTLACSAGASFGKTLTINGATVSNPYTLQVGVGTYSVVCDISGDTYNYTPITASNMIVVNPLVSCSNSNVFAFNKSVSTATDWTTLNFTTLVSQGYVRKNLGDISISNITGVYKNQTNGYYIVVNNTGVSNFTVKFGNYLANNSYSNYTANLTSPDNMTGYVQTYPAILYTSLDELTGLEMYPPNTTLMSIIHCSEGENYIPIETDTTRFLLASRTYVDKASLRVTYTADMYYSRQFYPEEADFTILNFYVIDAYENALDRIDFKMIDPNYYDELLQIYKPIEDTVMIITEGYFDASHYFSAYLMEDSDYYLRTIADDGTATSFGRITIVRPEEKELGKVSISLNSQAVWIANNIFMNANWNNETHNQIIVEYEDLINGTNYVNIKVYFQNDTLFQNETYYNSTSLSLPFDVPEANWNESFTVLFEVDHSSFSNSPLYFQISLLSPYQMDLGLSSLIYNLASLFVILFISGLGTRQNIVGGVVLTLLAMLLLIGMGWLTGLTIDIWALFIMMLILGVFAIIEWHQKGE